MRQERTSRKVGLSVTPERDDQGHGKLPKIPVFRSLYSCLVVKTDDCRRRGASMIESDTSEGKIALQYLVSIALGALAGAVGIIVAVIAELKWACWYGNINCNDGQGGIILVVLVPAMCVAGGLAGGLWPWLKAKTSSSSMLGQINVRPGIVKSRIFGWVFPLAVWFLFCVVLFLVLILLDRP
jgi:hypothetical protein